MECHPVPHFPQANKNRLSGALLANKEASMTESLQFPRLADEERSAFSQGQILKGQYIGALRSKKGKLKGMILQAGSRTYSVKLPKYLRPMLAWEIPPETFVQVWAYPEDDIWQASNILPLSAQEIADLQQQWVDPANHTPELPSLPTDALNHANAAKVCIQVCRKGKCYKQGSMQIWNALHTEVEANPDLDHVSIEATGCMKACKQGPNLRLLPKGKMLSQMTPDRAITILTEYR
jgi:hypothetical protein